MYVCIGNITISNKYFSICIVISVTLPYRNNTQVLFSEKPTSTKKINFRISDGALDTQNYSKDIPNNLYSQRRKVPESIPNIQERGKDKFPLTKDITLGQQGLPSKWDEKGSLSVQHPIESLITRTSTNQLNKDRQILRQTANLPRGNIFSSNTYENLNSNRRVDYDYQNRPSIKQQPLKPEADIRLDLQGITLENIKSFIGQPSIGSPTEPELPISTDLNLNKGTNKKDSKKIDRFRITKSNKTCFQNPSAEILYAMNLAHPYRIL